MQSWCHRRLQHLYSSSPIDMCDRLQPRPPFAPNRKHPGHETRQAHSARGNFEIACCNFDGYDWCKRAEWLAVLDFAVEPMAHFGRVRRREDAAVPKRARPELQS